MRLMLLFIAALGFAAFSPDTARGQVPPRGAVRCGADGCANLLGDSIQIEGKRGRLGGRELDALLPAEICANWLRPALVGRFTAKEACGDLKVMSTSETDNGSRVVQLSYGEAVRSGEDITFYPGVLFAKPRAFLPCGDVFAISFGDAESPDTIPAITTRRTPYFDGHRDMQRLFGRCGYRLSGHARRFHELDYPLPQWSMPTGAQLVDTSHVAVVLAPPTDIEDGPAILAELTRLADDPGERDQLCRAAAAESCAIPRRLVLGAGREPYDIVIAQCEHPVIDGEAQLPAKCKPMAVHLRTGEWLMYALVSPDSFFPSANGIGDADIVCVPRDTRPALDILRRKYPAQAGYKLFPSGNVKIVRKGLRSDVYTRWRENLILQVGISGNRQVVLTPTIYFNPQNTADQEEYSPITVQQYDFYVKKIIARMAPDMTCRDAR